jgi:DNA gyrase subunit A
VRTGVDEVSELGRNTQGVRLIRLSEGERLVGIERIESLEGESTDESEPSDSDRPPA